MAKNTELTETNNGEVATSKSKYIDKLKENIDSIVITKPNCKLCNSPNEFKPRT